MEKSKASDHPEEQSLRQAEAPLMAHGKKQIQQDQPKWSFSLKLASIGSSIGAAVPVGYCTGVMNSPAVHMRSWCNETLITRYDLHLEASGLELLWSAIVSIFLVGGAIGSVTGASIANRFGRRGCFYICGLILALGAVCFAVCRLLASVELLLLGRLLVGLAGGLVTAFMPMYHSELAALSQRSTLSPCCAMGLTAGVVVAQICSLQSLFGGADRWHIALAFYGLLVLLCYAPFRWYPESPKWLYIVKGRKEEARQQLQLLRGYSPDSAALQAELDEMELEASAKVEASGFVEVLRNPRLRLPLIIVCAFLGGQQLSGINAIFFYSVSIFRKAGLSTQAAEWANLGAGSLNLATSMLGPLLLERINRRPLMLFSTFFCTVCLFVFAMMLYFIESFSWFAIGCIGCIFLYIFFFQFGLGPMPFFIGAELFEVSPRPAAMSLGSVVYWLCSFIIGMAFPTLQNAWGALVFLPFSITCLLLFVLTKRYLPETRGRDPSEVAPLVADGFKSKVLRTRSASQSS
ncbi:solute carrier family 2, facilitated glucose transporter member 3-like isoform X1 [Drosophila obscura]|uniref:solute carrier family 2, facilitated glucose transporter member 3-like isoform X1 n=1 Tax=Drosophila obscura TaxID=7282 RepID=UPI000B9F9D69|nr:solute carrier family 2, facilitated glucose transporter member 3-like isoform X1 [Drosophila obscura]